MKRGDVDEWSVRRRWNASGRKDAPEWREYDGMAILEREDGVPRYIFHAIKDITREVEEESHNKILGDKYMKVFQTNMVAMSFYDSEGRLIDLNQRMRELCEFDEKKERYFRTLNLFNDPFVQGFFHPGSPDIYHVCGHVNYPEFGLDKYVETRIMPL